MFSILSLISILVSQIVSAAECTGHFAPVYQQNHISIAMVFGYEDFADEGYDLSGDDLRFESFVRKITAKCQNSNESACEFTRVTHPSQAIQTFKRVLFVGDHYIEFAITTAYSSYSYANSKNKTIYAEQQAAKTAETEGLFLDSLIHSDVVLYSGHSRDGGGPDFAPPVQFGSNGGVNYGWYHANRPGWKKMESALSSDSSQMKLLGLFSCLSSAHFSAGLKKLLPDSQFILSTSLVNNSMSAPTLTLLFDHILQGKCLNDLQSDLKTNHFVLVN